MAVLRSINFSFPLIMGPFSYLRTRLFGEPKSSKAQWKDERFFVNSGAFLGPAIGPCKRSKRPEFLFVQKGLNIM